MMILCGVAQSWSETGPSTSVGRARRRWDERGVGKPSCMWVPPLYSLLPLLPPPVRLPARDAFSLCRRGRRNTIRHEHNTRATGRPLCRPSLCLASPSHTVTTLPTSHQPRRNNARSLRLAKGRAPPPPPPVAAYGGLLTHTAHGSPARSAGVPPPPTKPSTTAGRNPPACLGVHSPHTAHSSSLNT